MRTIRSVGIVIGAVLVLAGCRAAPEPVETPQMRAEKARAEALAAKEAFEKGQYPLAIDHAKRGLQLDANSVESQNWLAAGLFAVHQEDEAVTANKRFIEMAGAQPEWQRYVAQAYDRLGWISVRRNGFDDAVRYFSLALEKLPSFPHALDGRGQAAYARKDYDGAIRDFSRALELGSTARLIATEYRGLAYYWKGQFDKALPDITAMLESKAGDPRTDRKSLLRIQAFCYLAVGQRNMASNLIARAREFTEDEKRYNQSAIAYASGEKDYALRQAGTRTGFGLAEAKVGGLTVLRVERVSPGGPAETAGLAVGDELASVNGVPISNKEQYRELVRPIQTGTKLKLGIVRAGAKRELIMTMGDAEYIFKSDIYLAPILAKPPVPSK